MMNKRFIEMILSKHLSEIAGWLQDELETSTYNNVEEPMTAKELMELLPRGLRRKLTNTEAFMNAISEGLITFDNGVWKSHFRSERQFIYFAGRVFCNDTVVGRKLFKGKSDCPVSELERLFGIKDLHNARKKLLKRKIPSNYQAIDILFDKCLEGGK